MKTIKDGFRGILIVLLISLTTTVGNAQNMLQGEPSQEIKEMASKTTEKWNQELALTTKQRALMEDKIIEFAIKREALLNSKMREEAKTERLLDLETAKMKDMRDILTKPQYDRYVVIVNERLKRERDDNVREGL